MREEFEQQVLYSIFEIDDKNKTYAILVHIDICNDYKTRNMEKL